MTTADKSLHFNFQRRFKKIFQHSYDELTWHPDTIKIGCWNVFDSNIHYLDLALKHATKFEEFDDYRAVASFEDMFKKHGVTDFETGHATWRLDNRVEIVFDTRFDWRLNIDDRIRAGDGTVEVDGETTVYDDEHYIDRAIQHMWSGGRELRAENGIRAQELIMAAMESSSTERQVSMAPPWHPYE
jgi:hypothetical protein